MIQKHHPYIILAALLMLSGILFLPALRGGREVRKPQEGVSRELAVFRKGQIAELRYDMSFDIPQETEEPLQGRSVIGFKLLRRDNVVLDFRGSAVNSVSVNERPVRIICQNEHIIIPKSALSRGENSVVIEFTPADQSLNRREEYLYTLAVPDRARTIYPCFDQPDMKAVFSLQLNVPPGWEAVSNAGTKPISTYLFAFSAGKWQKESKEHKGQSYTAYFRETDPEKLAQLPEIFELVFKSVDWMEDYTGIPQPFQKYDFVVVPGFQFGGMEHPGAILYNDKRIFLGANPTVDEQLNRRSLIAHETSHLWFGDAVTMEWFDDVWTKEVFANYFAAKIVEDMADGYTEPVVDASAENGELLKELRDFYVSAYSEDRTLGTNAVKQDLDNLKDAGLVYGQIIYDKAPIVMKYLVEILGEEAFQQGMRSYLNEYLYGNATWEKLISILDGLTPVDLTQWSQVWVNERGMPQISARISDNTLKISQKDPYGRGLVWSQNISATVFNKNDLSRPATVLERITLDQAEVGTALGTEASDAESIVLLNVPGGAYGQMLYEPEDAEFILTHLQELQLTGDQKLALLIDLNENRLLSGIGNDLFADAMITDLQSGTQPLILSLELAYLKEIASLSLAMAPAGGSDITGHSGAESEIGIGIEKAMLELCKSRTHECGQTAFRALMEIFSTEETAQELYRVWRDQSPYKGLSFSESDYMKMAYELALRMPEKYDELVQVQSERILNPDRRSEFQFVARAVNPDQSYRDSLFNSLMQAENRRIEPWTSQVLGYLNHPLRQQESVRYILPGLEVLQEVQRTGDIFFPKNWCSALLKGHHSPEAKDAVTDFLERDPDYPPLLRNKILQSADRLLRE